MVIGPTFSVDSRPIQIGRLVTVRGEVDLASAERLQEELDAHTEADLVIDLRSVDFIDSTGLRVLVMTRGRLDEERRTLHLVVSDGPVRRLLQMSGVESGFSILPSLEGIDVSESE